MGKVNLDDLDKYNSGGGNMKAKFLALKDDGDTAQVHFLLEEFDDLNNYIYNVHKVTTGKAKFPNRSVNCLRAYNDPIEDCPFCKAGENAAVKVFIPIYNIDDDEIQFFERPKAYIAKLQKIMHRYHDNFPGHIFDIERNGEKGDKATSYDFIETDEDDFNIDDYIDDIPELLGTGIVNASADDMEYYLDNGEFPRSQKKDDDEDDEPVRRRRRGKDKDEVDDEPPFDEDDKEEERPRRREEHHSSGRRVSAKEDRQSRRRSRNAEDDF